MSKTINRSALVAFSAQQMFELINDIESYPQYMTGCVDAKILDRGDHWLVAKLDLAKSGVNQSFTTRNTLIPPERMTMELVDGPFKIFKGTWSFTEVDEHSCKVQFHLEYEFSNFLLGMAAGGMMNQLAGEQVEALCNRAKSIYKNA